MVQPERFYSVKEVAEITGKSEFSIRLYVRQGRLRAGRVGDRGPLSIRGEAVNELIQSLSGAPEVA